MLIDHHTSWHIPWWRSGLLQQGQGTRDLQTWCICWILELVSHHSRSCLVGAKHSRSRTSDDDSSWYSVMFEILYSLKSTGSRSSRGSSTKQLSIMYLSLNNKKAGIRKIFCVIKNKTASSSGSLLKECYWTELWLTAWKHYLLLVDAWLLQLSFLQTSFWNLSATRTLFRRKSGLKNIIIIQKKIDCLLESVDLIIVSTRWVSKDMYFMPVSDSTDSFIAVFSYHCNISLV